MLPERKEEQCLERSFPCTARALLLAGVSPSRSQRLHSCLKHRACWTPGPVTWADLTRVTIIPWTWIIAAPSQEQSPSKEWVLPSLPEGCELSNSFLAGSCKEGNQEKNNRLHEIWSVFPFLSITSISECYFFKIPFQKFLMKPR